MSDSGITGHKPRENQTDETEDENERCYDLCTTEVIVGSKRMTLNEVAWALMGIAKKTKKKLKDLFAECTLNGTNSNLIKEIFGINDNREIGSEDIRINIKGEEDGGVSLHTFQTKWETREWLMKLTGWRRKIKETIKTRKAELKLEKQKGN